VWYLDCRIRGARYVVKLGKGIKRSVAAEIAAVKRAQILKGAAGIGDKRKDLSFEKAREHFEQWAMSNKKFRTVKSYKECLRRLAESFDRKRLSEISPFLVERHKQTRIQGGAKVRCNREIAVLKNLFNYCRGQKLYEGGNPAEDVKMLREPKRRLRFLEPEEEQRLLDAATSPLKELVIIGINCGLRIEAEALPMRWDDVDFRRSFLTVRPPTRKTAQRGASRSTSGLSTRYFT
jgi:integrase